MSASGGSNSCITWRQAPQGMRELTAASSWASTQLTASSIGRFPWLMALNRATRSARAERVALFSAISQGKRPIELAVSCVDAQDEAAVSSRMPCGACRQVMQELLPPDADIHVDGVGRRSLQQLLPEAFQLD